MSAECICLRPLEVRDFPLRGLLPTLFFPRPESKTAHERTERRMTGRDHCMTGRERPMTGRDHRVTGPSAA